MAVFVGCFAIAVQAQEKSLNRVVSERLIAGIDFSSWISETFRISPDSRRVAYVAEVANKRLVVVDGKEGKQRVIQTKKIKLVVSGANLSDDPFLLSDQADACPSGQVAFQKWIFDYNHKRPHGGINRMTPIQKLRRPVWET